ncbi:MAG TPA: DUF302 domain-containing protein [Fimbriimonas sp.]|nr:DUF302 domain-containing protein [Fimbriimonas sp.]
MSQYSIDRTLHCPFGEAIRQVKAALVAQGFGTLTEVDIQAALQAKIGKQIPGYMILGVCNPRLAADAIEAEPNIGVFLPCTVLVREDPDAIRVAVQDPGLMAQFTGNPKLEPLSKEARDRIEAALDTLAGDPR